MVESFALSNGIRVIARKISGVKSLSMGVYVGVGSSGETLPENGLAHFIEHTTFKGTEKRTAFDVSRDPELLGVMINAATTREYTYYYAKTLSEHTEATLEILSDIFLNSTYPQKELAREKGVVIEEINMYDDTPDDVCASNLSRAVFGDGAGYGRPIIGTKTNVRSFNKNAILDFKRKHYTTDNIVLSFAGDVDFESVRELCTKYFGRVPRSARAKARETELNNLCRTVVAKKDIEQEHIALGFDFPAMYGELFDEYTFIVSALGGGMSSRLFQAIREKLGLCYNIETYQQSYVKTGIWAIYAAVGLGAAEKTIAAIKDELTAFKKSGITEEEFRCVKEQLKSGLAFAEESTTTMMNCYGKKLLLHNKIYDFDERLKAIDRMTIERVNEIVTDRLDIERFALSKVIKRR